MMPKLSIVTVCRNESRHVEATCESIRSQTWRDFEWIVIDGASTDDTLTYIEPYARDIARFVSEPDTGIYNAMNKGIGLATGEYLLFLNGGDALDHPEVLEEVFGGSTHQADILYGDAVYIDNGRETIWKAPSRIASPLYFVNSYIQHQCSFIRRELFDKYGYYDESLSIVSDWKHWIIFALNECRFHYLGITVSRFRVGGVSSRRKDTVIAENARVLASYFHVGNIRQLLRFEEKEGGGRTFFSNSSAASRS